jgi:hypothetical protein
LLLRQIADVAKESSVLRLLHRRVAFVAEIARSFAAFARKGNKAKAAIPFGFDSVLLREGTA